jgi:hypothetical protein
MESKAGRLEKWLQERAPARVELADFEELTRLLAPVTESSLRRLLRASGAELDPLVAGVNQDSFSALGETLVALADCYERSGAAGRRVARSIVIVAKDHARLAARNERVKAAKRAEKQEMADWMLTWLENPGIFGLWLKMKENLAAGGLGVPPAGTE